MKSAASFAGDQSATTAAQAFPFKAEQGRCYRVVAAAAPTIRQLVVAIVDADGQTAAEYAEGDGGKEGSGRRLPNPRHGHGQPDGQPREHHAGRPVRGARRRHRLAVRRGKGRVGKLRH